MKILKILLIIVGILLALFLIIAIFLPTKVFIKETVEINANVNTVFEQVNNFHNWQKWSPFQENDPNMITSFEGPVSGVGSIMKWKSKDGNGSMIITEVSPNILIKSELRFEGMETSFTSFEFEKTSLSTILSWSVDVDDLSYPIGRWMGVFMGRIIRPDFRKGLDNLKSVCETAMLINENNWHISDIVEKEVKPVIALSIKDSCTVDGFSAKFEEIYSSISAYMQKMKTDASGSPFCVYYNWNPNGIINFEAGIPVSNSISGKGRIVLSELSGGNTVMVSYFGAYENSGMAHDAIDRYLKEKNKKCVGAPWEIYVTDPENEPDTAKWETQIYYPVQ